MFPNSPNTQLLLLKVAPSIDSVGNKSYKIIKKTPVVGIAQSITIGEHKLSVELKKTFDLKIKLNSFVYSNEIFAKIDSTFYKIEKTYYQGQWVELVLSKTDINLTDES